MGVGSQAQSVLAFGCAFDPTARLPRGAEESSRLRPLLVSGVSCGILSEPRRGASSVALTAGVRPRVHPRLHYSVLGALEYPVLLGRTDYTRGLIWTSIVEMSIATPLYIYIILYSPHTSDKYRVSLSKIYIIQCQTNI